MVTNQKVASRSSISPSATALQQVARPASGNVGPAEVNLLLEGAPVCLTLSPSRIDRVLVKAFQALVHALQAKDPYTAGHSLRVSAYARGIAEKLGLESDLIAQVELGGELHDIGKIGVAEALLHKAGRLTESEYQEVMQHTITGESILAPLLEEYPTVLQVVRSHHERLDGRGGPDGLAGEDIPLAARIVCVADSFDAMTSSRPYRAKMTAHAAVRELVKNAGHQFDPACVTALVELIAYAARTRRVTVTRRRDSRSRPPIRRCAPARVRVVQGHRVARAVQQPTRWTGAVTVGRRTSHALLRCA